MNRMLASAALLASLALVLASGAVAAERGGHDWSGSHVGVSVGGGLASGHIDDPDCNICTAALFNQTVLQAGANAGYDKQWDALVLGAEGEVDYGSQHFHGALNAANSPKSDAVGNLTWSAALLGRAGVAGDRVMFFFDAGPAAAYVHEWAQEDGSPNTRWKIAVWQPAFKYGGGAEILVASHLAIRVQYSVLTLKSRTAYSDRPVVGANNSSRMIFANSQATATLGAEWRF